MGAKIVLCDGFEVVPPPEMNDLILFGSEQSGSNCDESTVTTEEDGTVFSGDSSPGGTAEEEWSGPNPFSFYFVKQPAYDDPEIKAKINKADQEIYRCNKLRIDISNARKLERAEISSLFAQMESLVAKSEGYKVILEEKKKEFDILQESLRNLRCSTSDQLCFSKEELAHLIYRAHYQIEHVNNGVEEEDWVTKEIEKPTDGIILSEDSLAQKEASIFRLKSMAMELNEVKKEFDAITWKINHLTDKMGKIQNKIRVLDSEMAHILEKRDKSFERIKMLRIQRDKGNAVFFQSLAVMRKAKELAASGNVRDLEVLASSEVDRFMTHWNNDKAFRDDYVKRISLSLCERQLNRDGRNKDPEVQVVREKQAPFKTRKEGEVVHQTNREESSSNSSQDGNVITCKNKEAKKNVMDLNNDEESDVIDLEFSVYGNWKKEEEEEEEEEEVNEETLKERKREEQLEKARLALERKRKLQEKAAAKAAIRAQKEAEKKLKECEKKAKKKAAANPTSELDQSREASNELEKVRTLAVSGKERHQKERLLFPKQRSFRYKHRGRGTEALPKAILNRRKAHKYWVWGVSSAALALALFLVVLLLR